jgi:hypothetical protein
MTTRNLRLLEAFVVQEIRDVPHDLQRVVEIILNIPGRIKPRYIYDPQSTADDDGDVYLEPSATAKANCSCCSTSGRWVREDLGSGGGGGGVGLPINESDVTGLVADLAALTAADAAETATRSAADAALAASIAAEAAARIAADAAEAASRAAEDLTFLKKDGSRAMTGALDMGTHLINNVTDPAAAQDADTKAARDAAIAASVAAYAFDPILDALFPIISE